MDFASDNTAGVHPAVLEAFARAADGPAHSYGEDSWTAQLVSRVSALFERPLAVFPVVTGTAANSISISACVPPWGALYLHEEAHMAVDECGAPEFFSGGAKLVPLPGAGGRISAETLAGALAGTLDRGVHSVTPAAVSLTQSSERGTVYRPAEIAALAEVAHARGLKVHMDGARFANALVRLGCAPADITWRAGVDILSLGATKTGAMMAEAVVVFDPSLAQTLAVRRKRAGHLLSKMRFVSAQWLAMLEDELWLRLAGQANAQARALAAAIGDTPGVTIADPVEANAVFVWMPAALAERLLAAGAHFYAWTAEPVAGRLLYRLVCSYATTEAQIAAFAAALTQNAAAARG